MGGVYDGGVGIDDYVQFERNAESEYKDLDGAITDLFGLQSDITWWKKAKTGILIESTVFEDIGYESWVLFFLIGVLLVVQLTTLLIARLFEVNLSTRNYDVVVDAESPSKDERTLHNSEDLVETESETEIDIDSLLDLTNDEEEKVDAAELPKLVSTSEFLEDGDTEYYSLIGNNYFLKARRHGSDAGENESLITSNRVTENENADDDKAAWEVNSEEEELHLNSLSDELSANNSQVADEDKSPPIEEFENGLIECPSSIQESANSPFEEIEDRDVIALSTPPDIENSEVIHHKEMTSTETKLKSNNPFAVLGDYEDYNSRRNLVTPPETKPVRNNSVLDSVFGVSPTKSKIPVLSPDKKLPAPQKQRVNISPRPKSTEKIEISSIVEKFLDPRLNVKTKGENFLTEVFGQDLEIKYEEEQILNLSKSEIKNIIAGFKDLKEENWQACYNNMDLILGLLRSLDRLDDRIGDFVVKELHSKMECFYCLTQTCRSALTNKAILFIRDVIYLSYPEDLTPEFFLKSIEVLLPFTNSSKISKFIHKVALKSLCLMLGSLSIDSFIEGFNAFFSKVFKDKNLQGEKFACLFIITYYICNHHQDFTQKQSVLLMDKIIPFVKRLSQDKESNIRNQLAEIFLVYNKVFNRDNAIIDSIEEFYMQFDHKHIKRRIKPECLRIKEEKEATVEAKTTAVNEDLVPQKQIEPQK